MVSDLRVEMGEVVGSGVLSISALQEGCFPWDVMARNMQSSGEWKSSGGFKKIPVFDDKQLSGGKSFS